MAQHLNNLRRIGPLLENPEAFYKEKESIFNNIAKFESMEYETLEDRVYRVPVLFHGRIDNKNENVDNIELENIPVERACAYIQVGFITENSILYKQIILAKRKLRE